MQTTHAPIEVHDVTVAYDRKPVLWNVDLTIPQGKLVGVLGPNGAGKSTLLNAIMGLLPLASGNVRIWNEPLEKQRGRIAYVPQRESVDWDFPTNALDVVLMGRYGRLGLFRRPGKADRDIAMQCLEKVGMHGFASRQISQLSGGQQQRVFIARALAQDADIYLMDEPLAGVDATTERAIIDLLRELKSQGKTVVAVHHDLQTVTEYFDWLVLLNLRLVAAGPTSEVFTTERLAQTYGGRLKILADVADLVQQNSPLKALKHPA
ncbi:metal ABC transporter ATP-binding protein [bacterium]|nr:metal ABC transporter ATP-binding protein [bacterium]